MNIIKIDPKIKIEIARATIRENHPGFTSQYMDSAYVVNGNKIMQAAPNRQWDPWSDNANVVSVDWLVRVAGGADADGVDMEIDSDADDYNEDETLDFIMAYIPDQYDQAKADEEN